MKSAPPVSLASAFEYCEQIARRHYENFPVASLVLPRAMRPSVAALYAFARTADDFADEGERSASERLQLLSDWQTQLDECYRGNSTHPIFVALGEVIRQKAIPKQLLTDLLTAFTMDVTKHRYHTFDELLFYCRHSANPVGRLVLHLFDDASERNCLLSDNICTGLQLANFWQDVSVDIQKNRIYFPLEDRERFGYTEHDLHRRVCNDAFRNLMKFEVERTRQLFDAGKPLLREATAALQFELRLTWLGGMKILEKITRDDYNVFAHRPMISVGDKVFLLVQSLVRKP
jgi:phytoene synthase